MLKIVDYINSNLDLGEEYEHIFGHKMSTGKFSCPNPEHSHVNNTPSCKRYGNVFKCFGQCNKVFGVYDLLKWYNPKRIDEIKSTVLIKSNEQKRAPKIQKVEVKSKDIKQALEEITGICL